MMTIIKKCTLLAFALLLFNTGTSYAQDFLDRKHLSYTISIVNFEDYTVPPIGMVADWGLGSWVNAGLSVGLSVRSFRNTSDFNLKVPILPLVGVLYRLGGSFGLMVEAGQANTGKLGVTAGFSFTSF